MYPKSDSSNVCGRRAGSRSSRLARNEASSFRSMGLVADFWIREILARRLSTRRWVGMNRRPAHSSKPKTNASVDQPGEHTPSRQAFQMGARLAQADATKPDAAH